MASGRHGEGVEALRAALATGACADGHVNLGAHLGEEGDERAARRHYAAALALRPLEHGLRLRLAIALSVLRLANRCPNLSLSSSQASLSFFLSSVSFSLPCLFVV